MTLTKTILIGIVLVATTIPTATNKQLGNYGVKERPVGQAAVSSVVSSLELLKQKTYGRMKEYRPYVLAASKQSGIPANVLMAILYEEGIHRKPVDLNTYGPAQLGVAELDHSGLPPRVGLLEDPEISVHLLAAKLKRLQRQTGSLQTAIILHNGYSDYLSMIQLRAKDPRIIEILETKFVEETLEV